MKKKTFHLIFGSTSDYTPDISRVITDLKSEENVEVKIHILSCHRHFFELFGFLSALPRDHKHIRIIAAGSMAFALPGIIRTMLNVLRNPVQVIGVALEGKEPLDIEAAELSISRLPGRPVLMARDNSTSVSEYSVYHGIDGFREACLRALNEDFSPFEIKDPPPCYTSLTPEEAAELFIKK